ncbi:uncharacterized protein BYT42DRAFT_482173, partial [Radiomyces spectabilis]|uniref:uncharacterized protein n=1 Tax=Radiomyces spectabilis TaxID=64574 RepID=UPI00221E685C
ENRYISLLSMIDAVYPPRLCTICDIVSATVAESDNHFRTHHPSQPRYACVHPHCGMQFVSRGALRFHLTRSHIIRHATKPIPDPPFLHYTITPRPVETSPHLRFPVAEPSPSIPSSPSLTDHEQSMSPTTRSLSPPRRSSFKIHTMAVPRAPRGSKKIILSHASESLLNSVYNPLQCPACHQLFNRKTNVIKHLADKHHGEEPYHCVFANCVHPRRYATREGLVYHILRAHD